MDYQRKVPRSLWQSGDEPTPVKRSPAWVAEINRRVDDLESGRVKGISEEEVNAVIERRFGIRVRSR